MASAYDPTNPSILRDPHRVFASLRTEDPVHWNEAMSSWIVTSYELATDVLTDSAIYSADRLIPFKKHVPEQYRDAAAEMIRWLSHWMVFRDPPDHTRLRRHISQVLNLPVFESLRGTIISVVNTLLDTLPRDDDFDFVNRFSIMMPGTIVMDLLGVPRERLLEAKQWSDDMMTFIGSSRGVTDKYERARRGAVNMSTCFREAITDRRQSPRDDILSQLIASDLDGRKMTDDELIGSMMMLLNGGHETTANLINNSIIALCAHPESAARLRADPSLMPRAIDEVLRYDGPILSVGRLLKEDTRLGDRALKTGDRIFLMLTACNRDPEVFEDPDRFDIQRHPNPHMAFGKGPHFCLGAPLARIEGQIAVSMILDRFKSIELREPPETIPWINSLVTRGPTRLPMRLR